MAPHSSTFAWKIPWTEEPGRLQSMGSQSQTRLSNSLSLFTFMHWRRKWQPTPVFLPGESQGWGSRGLPSMGSHRVRHDWSDLATATIAKMPFSFVYKLKTVIFPVSPDHLCQHPRKMLLQFIMHKSMETSKQLFEVSSIIFWKRQWHPTPVLLPGKSHGRRSLVGCSPRGR